ncbi:MAG: type IV toxin-antitoxin system AbiEi family antitoxin domain-containing protein [Alphaproteobacteria bacterium]
MGILKDKKLRSVMQNWQSGFVATTYWFKSLSVSPQLVQKYIKSGWIEAIGRGAYKKPKDTINWYGGLACIQQQLNVHLGGATALSIRGNSHYVRFGKEKVFLFSDINQKLPKWFLDYDWGNPIEVIKTSFLPQNLAINPYEFNSFSIEASSPERAILECLYLSPDHFDLLECYQILEGLNNLRPDVLQDLLIGCNSIKVKRLFLYMAKKAKLPVLEYIDLDKIDLGSGKRYLTKKSVYEKEFKISIPKELVDYV